MNQNKQTQIFEYFYYLFCFLNIYSENKKNVQYIDDKLKSFSEKMLKINSENSLSQIDNRFSTIIYDLESILMTKVGYDNFIGDHKDFIESFAEQN